MWLSETGDREEGGVRDNLQSGEEYHVATSVKEVGRGIATGKPFPSNSQVLVP